jgi:transcriptional regulator with XRE-family HTH domain
MLVKLNGPKIMELRQARGLSRDAFVEVSGVSRSSLHMIETNRQKLGNQVFIAQQIALALGVTLEDIQSEPPARQRRPNLRTG